MLNEENNFLDNNVSCGYVQCVATLIENTKNTFTIISIWVIYISGHFYNKLS